MPNPNAPAAPAEGLTDQEEYDLEQAELIAANGGKAPIPAPGDAAAGLTDDQKWAAVQQGLEAEAARKGWKPKDKYEGDAKQWVDAQTFLARGERFVSNLQKEVAGLKAKLESFEGTKAAFVKFHEETVKGKDKELGEALKQLRIQRSEAQADGDHAQAVEIEDRIEVLSKERKDLAEATPVAAAAPAAPTTDPVLEAWIGDGNSWFTSDAKLRNYAIQIGDELRKDGETLQGRAFLDKVTDLMKQEFPAKFENPNRQRGSGVESGGSRTSTAAAGAAGKSERDLPKADRDLMNEFVRNGWITKEKFLSEYRWN